MRGPLEGIRIIDLTHVWAGPLGTRILADLGAEVIKVEASSGRGGATLPPGGAGIWQGNPNTEPWNHQALFNKLNRNKQSVCLDLKSEAGRDVFLDLVRDADAVIENFSARAMKSLGLNYEELVKVNPVIIYVAMPGYGTYGPISDYVAFGPSVELMTGLTTLLGYGRDEPRTTSMALPDAISGVTAAAALMTALVRKRRLGKGGFVDLALHESAINMLGEYVVAHQLTDATTVIRGNRHQRYAPQGIYPCKGGTQEQEARSNYIFISCRDDNEWHALSEVVGEGWHVDSRFSSETQRRQHHDDLDQLISGFTAGFDKIELMELLQSRGVPAGAVMVAPEFMADAQVIERNYFVELGDESIAAIPFPGSPVRIDGTRHEGWKRAPRLGEHNEEILSGLLGYSQEKIKGLIDAGVLASRPRE